MTNLETLIIFVLGIIPALTFWILLISYVANKIFESIERDKQYVDELTGYDKIVDQIKNGVCEESLVDVINTLGEKKEERDEYLKRNSDYEIAKYKYAEDKLNEYLNTDEAVQNFGRVFSKSSSYEAKKDEWKHHLENKRKEFGTDFDNL